MTALQPVSRPFTEAAELDDVTDIAREYTPAAAAQDTYVPGCMHWDGWMSPYCIIEAASTCDEPLMPKLQSVVGRSVECDEITSASENVPTAAVTVQDVSVHWDGWISVRPPEETVA